jgi:perosamine synthetase
MKIPLSRPDLDARDIRGVVNVLKTPHLSLGPKLPEFEKKFARFIGSRYAVAVNSGTSALHLAVRALGLTRGDEVITTPFSFVASSNCLLFEGAKPVFVDIDENTLNIDVSKIERAITRHTRAILAVHIFGRPLDMTRIMTLARKHKLMVIEDACEAIGAAWRGRKVGTFGAVGTFAFYPNKQMTTGEGGMLITDQLKIAQLCQSMRNQGRAIKGGAWLVHERLGYNYRLSDINCALGLSQLARLPAMLQRRQAVAEMYRKHLSGIKNLVLPNADGGRDISWFVYVIRVQGVRAALRDRIRQTLAQRGIQTNDYFRPIHVQPFYRKLFGYAPGDFPVTERVAAETIALPFHNRLSEREIKYVCSALQNTLMRVHA